MALVKTSKITPGKARPPAMPAPAMNGAAPKAAVRNGTAGVHNASTITERIAAATEQLASGITESSAAAEELRRSMEQIAGGAEEAAGAAQEQLAASKRIIINLNIAKSRAEDTRRRTAAVQQVLLETSVLIAGSVRAIEQNAERQSGSVDVISELERRGAEIADITKVVSGISDQTNLLALNAAIEAARAGDHGRGFAVVAEEVRALAETSEKSAQTIQGYADTLQKEVRTVALAVKEASQAALTEAKSGADLTRKLEARSSEMTVIAVGAQDILDAATQAERAAVEAQRGAEQVAGAAEEQSAAASQAQSAIREQAQSLDQSQTAAQNLAELTEKLRTGKAGVTAADEIGSSAEELSAAVQEMSGTATEIMAAISQINKGAQQQSAATLQTSAALAQIEKSAGLAKGTAALAVSRVNDIEKALREGRASVGKLVQGVTVSLEKTRVSLNTIVRLESVGRNIEKIVDTISLVAVQTSMLAVSGSVEAARAGDAGRGFALVSGDIRGLARETATNVERIKDTVRSILDQIGVLRRDLEQVISSNETEVSNNKAVTSSLERLEGDIAALATANNEIQQGADAILAAAAETSVGAKQIAAAAEEAGSAARQAATASSQQARGAEDLAASIEEIASLAQELK